MTTQIDPETAALNLLLRGKPDDAVQVLRQEIERDVAGQGELMRILNLISPCQMVEAAKDGLRRRLANRRIEEYQLHRPADADISRVVTA